MRGFFSQDLRMKLLMLWFLHLEGQLFINNTSNFNNATSPGAFTKLITFQKIHVKVHIILMQKSYIKPFFFFCKIGKITIFYSF